MKYTVEELKTICELHIDWLKEKPNGVRASLSRADLSGAYLSGANLSGADLSGAYLSGVKNNAYVLAMAKICAEGDIIGWKKCRNNVIVKLLIPSSAKRSNAAGRKCRAEYADVLEIIGADCGISDRDPKTIYTVGKRMIPDSFDDNRFNECSSGIHFFITREEAEAYNL